MKWAKGSLLNGERGRYVAANTIVGNVVTCGMHLFLSRVLTCSLVAWFLCCGHAVAFSALHSFDFNTPGNVEGWNAVNSTVTVSDGGLKGSSSTGDPQLTNLTFDFLGNASSGLLLRYRGSQNGQVTLFWGTQSASSFAADRSLAVSYSGSGEWKTLFIPARGHAGWDDQTIRRLRVDPAGTAGATFEIDWLRVLSWDYDGDGWADDIEGGADSDGNGLLDLEDHDSDGDRTPDEWRRAILNAPGSLRFDFETDGGGEGWTAGGGLTINGVDSGNLNAVVAAANPQLTRSRLYLQGALVDGMIIRLRATQPGSVTLRWTHDGIFGSSFVSYRGSTVSVAAGDSEFSSIYFDLRTATEWKGRVITGLRIEPAFPVGTPVSIDWIHTSGGDYDRDGIADMVEGTGDIDQDGLPNYQDVDRDGDGVSDTEETRRGWFVDLPVEATMDSDGDGVNDAAEAIAGTDPYSRNDRPVLDIRPSGDGMNLGIRASHGRSYLLERSEDLSVWTPEPVAPQIQGTPDLSWEAGPLAGRQQEFFRMRIGGPLEMPAPVAAGAPVVEVGGNHTAYLDNGVLRLGAPTSQGASINHISASGGENLVNWYDPGRLIQQSYYAGADLNRQPVGQSQHWSPWPWNPIQGGDASNRKSQVLEMTRAEFGTGFFTRTVPLLWDMTTGEKARAWMDQWNQFEPDMPDVIRVTCRLTCFRDPADPWTVTPRHQELPAVYFVRSLSRVVTYQGSQPWTNGALQDLAPPPGPPWIQATPKENWVAMVNPDTQVGMGLYSPMGSEFWWVGATGSPPGGPTNPQTMHMAPIRTMTLERDSIVSYRYWLIHGTVESIRARVYQLRARHPDG